MKHLLVLIEDRMQAKFKGKYHYVANIHDAINIEIEPDIKDEVSKVLEQSFLDTSANLGLKYPVKGEPHFGLNQYETH